MFVYKIYNILNDKIYIGVTIRKNYKKRFVEHQSLLRYNKHYNSYLQKSWNKYGEQNFIFDIINTTEDVSELYSMERYYIWFYKSNDSNFGYNQSTGGEVGFKQNDDAKKKLSKKHKGRVFSSEHKKRISEANSGTNHYKFGKKLDPEHRARISQGLIGRKNSEESNIKRVTSRKNGKFPVIPKYGKDNHAFGKPNVGRKVVDCFDLELNFIKQFPSVRLAAAFVGIGKDATSTITRCCQGKTKSVCGYIFKFNTEIRG